MKPNIYVRVAAICMFIHTIGHTFGTFTSKAPNQTIAHIQQEMLQNTFSFMGRQASLSLFFEGYAVAAIFSLLFSSFVIWWLATQTNTELGSRLLALSFFFLLVLSIVEIAYRFPFYFTALAAICLLIPLVKTPSPSSSNRNMAEANPIRQKRSATAHTPS